MLVQQRAKLLLPLMSTGSALLLLAPPTLWPLEFSNVSLASSRVQKLAVDRQRLSQHWLNCSL